MKDTVVVIAHSFSHPNQMFIPDHVMDQVDKGTTPLPLEWDIATAKEMNDMCLHVAEYASARGRYEVAGSVLAWAMISSVGRGVGAVEEEMDVAIARFGSNVVRTAATLIVPYAVRVQRSDVVRLLYNRYGADASMGDLARASVGMKGARTLEQMGFGTTDFDRLRKTSVGSE
jgi:hypothetical protein